MNQIKLFVKRYPLIVFFVLAITLSWGNFLLSASFPSFPFFFPFGPLIAGLITAGIGEGRSGLKDMVSRCLRWRVGIRWFAAALLVPVFIGLATVVLNIILGTQLPQSAQLGPWYSLFLLFPMAIFDAPIGEDTGWRGFAMPRFPANHSPLFNTLVLGLLIAIWHIPLGLSEPGLSVPYFLGAVASAVVTNWIYFNTRGSALMAVLYHSAANTVGLYFAPLFPGPDQVRYFWVLTAVNLVVAVTLVLINGPTLQRQSSTPTETAQAGKPSTTR